MWLAAYALGVALLSLSGAWGTDVLGPRLQLSDVAFAVAALGFVVELARGRLRLHWVPADAALAAYVACAALSTLLSATPRPVKLLGLLLLATIYVLPRYVPREVLARGWLGGAVFAGVVGLVGIVLFYAGWRVRPGNPFVAAYGSIPVGDYPRIVGFFGNPNMYCSYLACALAAVAWRRPRGSVAMAALLLMNALFTLSVAVGGIALGAAVWWRGRGRKLLLAGASLAAAALLALTLVQLVPRGSGDVNVGPWDVRLAEGGRIDIWRGALATAARHPVVGQGYGTLVGQATNPRATVSMEKWGTAAMTDTAPTAVEAHDVWLNVLGQTGVLGLAAFALFVGLVTRASRRDAALLAGVVAALLYHGLFAAIEDARHLWLLLGVAVQPGDARPRGAPAPAPRERG
jgi:O-antigen ligase